jgi:hypothetical protein
LIVWYLLFNASSTALNEVRNYFYLCEHLFTLWTHQIGFSFVRIQMFFLIRLLIKFHLATFNRALKRLLIGVDSQVIEQVVPSLKYLTAILVVAGEDGRYPISGRISILYFSKSLSIGHLHLFRKRSHINRSSINVFKSCLNGKSKLLDNFLSECLFDELVFNCLSSDWEF